MRIVTVPIGVLSTSLTVGAAGFVWFAPAGVSFVVAVAGALVWCWLIDHEHAT